MDPILIQGTLTAIVKWIGKSRAKKKEIERIALAAEQARIEQKRANEVRREDMRQRSQRCCGACAIVVGADAAFCHSCGASGITTVGEIRDKKQVADQLREKKIETERKREQDIKDVAVRVAEQERQRKLMEERARCEELEKQKQEVLRRNERREAARARCLELLVTRYCPHCNAAYSPKHRYCTACGTATEPFHERWAYDYAREEFPDIITNESDFKKIANL